MNDQNFSHHCEFLLIWARRYINLTLASVVAFATERRIPRKSKPVLNSQVVIIAVSFLIDSDRSSYKCFHSIRVLTTVMANLLG